MDLTARLTALKTKSTFKLADAGGVDPAVVDEMITFMDELIATLNEKSTALKEMAGKADEAGQQAQDMKNQMEKMQKEKDDTEKEIFFAEAIKSGKIRATEMKELDSWKLQWDKDKEFVKKILGERQPEKLDGKKSTVFVAADGKLSDEDRAIMLERSLDPDNAEHVKLYKKANE